MIVTVPSRPKYLEEEFFIPKQNPVMKIVKIKDGMLIYNMKGVLIGQMLEESHETIVSIADAGSLRIKRIGKEIEIKSLGEDGDVGRHIPGKFVLFGKPEIGQYTVFRIYPTSVKPKLFMQAVLHPIDEKLINIRAEDGENTLLAILLGLGIGSVLK